MILDEKQTIIKCPTCGLHLHKNNEKKMFSCSNNHCFDVAKQGYVNLLMSNQSKLRIHGDSAEMLDARKSILYGNYYKSVSDYLNKTVESILTDKNKEYAVLDMGCGIGYYLTSLKEYLKRDNIDYHGIDIAKSGIIEATKHDKEISWVVGSSMKLPYLDNSIDVIISIFSPISESECERVLKSNGVLIVISPNKNHLMELKRNIYPTIIEKNYEVNELSSAVLSKINSSNVIKTIVLEKSNLKNLLLMTPHYWKTTKEAKEKFYLLDSLSITIDVVVDEYKKIN
ncbi:methyltransferase domain-containing protein [Mycoplasmatota bacterium WC44]